MTLTSISNVLERVRQGAPVLLVDDAGEWAQGTLMVPAERAGREAVAWLMNHGRGPLCAAIPQPRLEEMAVGRLSGGHRGLYFASVDAADGGGFSAEGRANTIDLLLDADAPLDVFTTPGNVFLLSTVNGGVLRKAARAEAAVDLCAAVGLKPMAVVCEALDEQGAPASGAQLEALASGHSLPVVSVEDLIAWRRERDTYVTREAEANLPTAYGDFRMVGYVNRLNGEHHVALVKGSFGPEDDVLVRVHSECLTGDAFHSLKCDCGEQLASALTAIEAEGCGILLYLRQEGRGIGLINKIKAYHLQEQGLDTEEANLALGFPADLRDYGIGAQILSDLGARRLRLMTNNPKKLVGIHGHGIEVVERVPLIMQPNAINRRYFETKEEKMGHLFR